jgi:DNA-binding beta-propeller fold protein YncE
MRFPLLALLLAAGCKKGYGLEEGSATDAPSTPGAGSDTDFEPGVPSETEEDKLVLPPAQTDVYVFIPNPERDTLTRLDVNSREIRTAVVGDEPTVARTTPDYRTAVVFNRGGDSVSIVDADTLAATEVAVRDDLNQMVLSPDGQYAVLWHDIASERADDPAPTGVQSFNECSFVNIATKEHFPMAVGFDPKSVVFTPDGATAAVVSDQYLAVVDLRDPVPFPTLIAISDQLVDPPTAEEVVLAPDASYAFVRQVGAQDLAVVDLGNGTVDRVPLGADPTDLDLSPDGRTAVVVARDLRSLLLVDVADPLAAPAAVAFPSDSPFGSVAFAPEGDLALLYTNGIGIARYAVWDVATGTITERSLVKPVASLAITPTGGSALIFHTLADADDADPLSPFAGEYAVTLVSLADFRTNPILLPGEPIGFANANNGRYGYFVMDGQYWLGVVDYVTLLHEEVPLASLPEYVGVLPDLTPDDGVEPPAWASQDHPLGRITLYDPLTSVTDTITGFELNSEIEDGS